MVFCGFAVTYLREPLRWNYLLGFVLILAAVGVVFGFDPPPQTAPPPPTAKPD